MPIPATTGALHTNVKDMKVGDYIICKYNASSGAVGTFSELGTSTATEIPISGSATPTGSFYLVKVDKGLLIADRNIQHTISWDVLNAGRLIQGMSWGNNSVPKMTSGTSPNGVVSSDSVNNTLFADWQAFDKTTQLWINNYATGWIQYKFPTSAWIIGYSLQAESANRMAKSWTFEGSQDGAVWTVLDERTNQVGWATNEKRSYSITNKNVGMYMYYRVNISSVNGGANVGLAEVELFNVSGVIRSLTGGVAYADANGNSSTTDLSLGAFPSNNNWDKYIIKFPVSKIQSGKTLDDVFHHVQTLCSWTQETPVLAKGASTTRVGRGRINGIALTNPASSYSGVDYGFRPVFEYQE